MSEPPREAPSAGRRDEQASVRARAGGPQGERRRGAIGWWWRAPPPAWAGRFGALAAHAPRRVGRRGAGRRGVVGWRAMRAWPELPAS